MYNLLDEQWISVLYRTGQWRRIGIKQAFHEAHQIREITSSNPMDRVAILRFLLALLYWCKGNPPEDRSPGNMHAFPTDWFDKLDEYWECFNMLGEGMRFYQDNDASRRRAATDLIQEVPTGNNFRHFRHSTDKINGLCIPCCAFGLLRLPMFSVSGLPNLKAGINGRPPIYVMPVGNSLFGTLYENWLPVESLGVPAWIDPKLELPTEKPVPILTGLTMLSRRVWLHNPESTGTCISCSSSKAPLIQTCEFESAGEQRNERWSDPHVIYQDRTPRKSYVASDLTAAGKFSGDRPVLKMFSQMLRAEGVTPDGESIKFLAVGFATDQAKNIDVWEKQIALLGNLSIPEDLEFRNASWQKEGAKLYRRLSDKPKKGGSEKLMNLQAAVASIRPHVEHLVSSKLGELLLGDDDIWSQVFDEYKPMMHVIARSLAPGYTIENVMRRRRISNAAPNIRTKSISKPRGEEKEEGKT